MRMSRSLLFSFLVLAAVPVFAAQQSSPSTPLINARGDVIATYGRISEASGAERGRLFSMMSPTMQADLWMLHLEYFLEDHEELTLRQRIVIHEAMGFITSGALSISRDDPEWPTRVQVPLNQLEFRMIAELGKALAYEAAAHLGPPETYSWDSSVVHVVPMEHLDSQISKLRPKPLDFDCECATTDDWCCVFDCLTSPTPKCHPSSGIPPDSCTFNKGCGWLMQSSCNGMCGA
jgi:hypothetical protein